MKIKFYLIILFFINKSYHMEFINNLDFTTALSYSILFLGAARYIHQDYTLLKNINELKSDIEKNNMQYNRTMLPIYTFLTGVASYTGIKFVRSFW